MGMHPKLPDGEIAGPVTTLATAGQIGAMLRAMPQGCALHDPALLALLIEAASRLTAIARATGGDVAIVSTGAGDGASWHAVSAGQYRYDSTGGAWSFPRPGDADYLWGERARAVLEGLVGNDWQGLAPVGGETGLLVRSSGAWLMTCAGTGDSALFHAVRGDGLELVGLQGGLVKGAERAESPADLVRSNRPITFITLEEHARAQAEPAPAIPEPLEDWGDDAPEIATETGGETGGATGGEIESETRPKIVLSEERGWKDELLSRMNGLIARGLSRRR